MPSTQNRIDAGMYPHLLQLVVDFAPHESLIALRAGYRALRKRPNMHLNAGQLFTDPDHVPGKGEQPRVTVSSEHGRLPALADWALGPPAPPRGYEERRAPGRIEFKDAADPPSNAKDARGVALTNPPHVVSFPPDPQDKCMPLGAIADLRYTTAIDLVGSVASEYTRRLVESKPFRRGPGYVRVLDHEGRDVFTQAAPPPDYSDKHGEPWHANMGGLNAVKFTTLSRFVAGQINISRLDPKMDWDEITNIAYHPDDTYTANRPPRLGSRLEGVRSLTYILHRAASPCAIVVPEEDRDNTSRAIFESSFHGLKTHESPFLLDTLFRRAARNDLNDIKVTIVDVDVLAGSKWLKGVDGSDLPAQFRCKCAQLSGVRIDPRMVPRLFEFMTMDEFRAGLPASRNAALETTREGRL